MQYIYALATEGFKSKQDLIDGDPTTEYFYVGRTSDLHKREAGHRSKAKTGSTYPYHEKIRDLDENWYIEKLAEISDDQVSDYEEFYILTLTGQGHPLLNIKRGDKINNASEINQVLSNLRIKTAVDYSKLKIKNRNARIQSREYRHINESLINLGLDASGIKRLWKLGDEEILADKYVSRNDIIELKMPSINAEFDKLLRLVDNIAASHNDI